MIQVIVPPHLVPKHKDIFKIGKTYIIQNFKVTKNDLTLKATTHNFKLVFCGATSARAADFLDIPLNNFRFTSFEDMFAGSFPLTVSNAWNGTKLSVNDFNVDEIKKFKESFKGDVPLLSSSSFQNDITQDSQYSHHEKFIWKA
ncbi:uncharacterized protein LOC127078489 [Lathyrus oleraceus]|uniref:uncharacterized protein LOC127078489 n=1 Tax=Pisum sativum TaxID=3888 RepID=UPI001FC66749|nr:uncharacterized protein LOC127078489 [Pisum sativum]